MIRNVMIKVFMSNSRYLYRSQTDANQIHLYNLINVMNTISNFRTLEELVKMLDREKVLFRDMFERRKTLAYRTQFALEIVEYKKERIQYLLDPNRYIHFGDFDLAGIHIFLTEFHKHLGCRSTFLIPSDIEDRIASGSRQRYNEQYKKFGHLSVEDRALRKLIDWIHKYHRGYDQEGYIGSVENKE